MTITEVKIIATLIGKCLRRKKYKCPVCKLSVYIKWIHTRKCYKENSIGWLGYLRNVRAISQSRAGRNEILQMIRDEGEKLEKSKK